MTDVTVAATEHGSVLLTVITHTGQQGEADLTIELAEKVKAQIETALVSARLCKINTALLSLEAPAHSVGLLQGRSHLHNRQCKRRDKFISFFRRSSSEIALRGLSKKEVATTRRCLAVMLENLLRDEEACFRRQRDMLGSESLLRKIDH